VEEAEILGSRLKASIDVFVELGFGSEVDVGFGVAVDEASFIAMPEFQTSLVPFLMHV